MNFPCRAVALLACMPVIASAQPKLGSLQQYQLDAGHSIFEFSIGFAFTATSSESGV